MTLNICCVTSYLANVSSNLRISSFSCVKNHLIREKNLGVSITLPPMQYSRMCLKTGRWNPSYCSGCGEASLAKHLVRRAWKDVTIFAELLPLMKSWSDTSEARTTSRYKTRKNLIGWLICASSCRVSQRWHFDKSCSVREYKRLVKADFTEFCHSWLTIDGKTQQNESVSIFLISLWIIWVLHASSWTITAADVSV